MNGLLIIGAGGHGKVVADTAATIRQGITIGRDARVGAGAVVVADVADGSTVVGVPAKDRSGSQ